MSQKKNWASLVGGTECFEESQLFESPKEAASRSYGKKGRKHGVKYVSSSGNIRTGKSLAKPSSDTWAIGVRSGPAAKEELFYWNKSKNSKDTTTEEKYGIRDDSVEYSTRSHKRWELLEERTGNQNVIVYDFLNRRQTLDDLNCKYGPVMSNAEYYNTLTQPPEEEVQETEWAIVQTRKGRKAIPTQKTTTFFKSPTTTESKDKKPRGKTKKDQQRDHEGEEDDSEKFDEKEAIGVLSAKGANRIKFHGGMSHDRSHRNRLLPQPRRYLNTKQILSEYKN